MEASIGSWQISVQQIWPTGDQLAEIYDTAAPWWHRRMVRFGHLRAYGRLIEGLRHDGVLDHVTDGTPVLDCGIGTGAFSVALADSLGVRPRVSGVDLAPEMVRRASRRLERREERINANEKVVSLILTTFRISKRQLTLADHILTLILNLMENRRVQVR